MYYQLRSRGISIATMPLYFHISTTVVSCGKSVARKLLQQKLECVQNYGMRLILSKLSRTLSEDLRRMLAKVVATHKYIGGSCFELHWCIDVCINRVPVTFLAYKSA